MSIKEFVNENRKVVFSALSVIVPSIIMTISLEIGIVLFIASVIVMYHTKKIEKGGVVLAIVLFFIIVYSFSVFFNPAVFVARNSGTVMNDNWWNGLNWIRENTEEDAVIATYWDFGHFITSIARRPVVFDGASQSDLYTRPDDSGKDGLVIENYDHSIEHIILYENGNKTTARIKDIASVLLTDNETLAVELLHDYRINGTGPMYFIASGDLLGKSFWWTYFSTWSPTETKGCPGGFNRGECYSYSIVGLTNARPLTGENSVSYSYMSGQGQGFVVVDRAGTLEGFLFQSGQLVPVEKLFYIKNDGSGVLTTNPSAQVKGLLWLEPSRQTIIYIPPELENSLFTQMFLFNGRSINGEPLKNFELINQWGGEVKLYKVKFPGND